MFNQEIATRSIGTCYLLGGDPSEQGESMQVKMLDHIALYMNDRDEAARFLTTHLGFHVVDHTERYTLVGAGGRLGKLTLFDAPQGTRLSPGEISRVTIRVADPE